MKVLKGSRGYHGEFKPLEGKRKAEKAGKTEKGSKGSKGKEGREDRGWKEREERVNLTFKRRKAHTMGLDSRNE